MAAAKGGERAMSATVGAKTLLAWKREHHDLLNRRLLDRPELAGARGSLHALLSALLDHCSLSNARADGRLVCWPQIGKASIGLASWLGQSDRHIRNLIGRLDALGVVDALRGPEAGAARQHAGRIQFADGREERTGRGYQFVLAVPFRADAGRSAAGVSAPKVNSRQASRVLPLLPGQRAEFAAHVGDEGVVRYLGWLEREWHDRVPDEADKFAYHRKRFSEWRQHEASERSAAAAHAAEQDTQAHIARRRARLAAVPKRGSAVA